MTRLNPLSVAAYWLLTAALAVAATLLVLYRTPVESTMGPIQKIFYLHLPAAIFTFVGCLICFIGSIGYLAQRTPIWDHLSDAAARVAVVLCTLVLLTGMIWGRTAWGQWWTWSPRLTFSLVLWLLYVVYLMIRMSVESGQRRAVIAAVYSMIAFLDVPLVWLSTRLMVDIHPTNITLAPEMKRTLGLCFIPMFFIAAGLLVGWFRRNQGRQVVQAESPMQAGPAPFQWIGGQS